MRSGLGAGLRPIYGIDLSVDDEVVDAVLDEGCPILAVEQPLRVGFVFREQQGGLAIAIEIVLASLGFTRLHNGGTVCDRLQRWPGIIPAPRPAVTEPECRQHV